MVNRRQAIFNTIGATFVPAIAQASAADASFIQTIPLPERLGVHETVLKSIYDRLGDILPAPAAIIESGEADGNARAFTGTVAGHPAWHGGRWRFETLQDDTASGFTLAGAMGLGCAALAARLATPSAMRYRSGFGMAGLAVLVYEGFGTSLCVLAPNLNEAQAAPFLVLNH